MRILVLPLVAVGVIFFAHNDEPTENQMRGAFERSLAVEVADTMAFIGESGGPKAVERVRMVGNDRFEIQKFRKAEGRFYNSSEGIKFAFEPDFQVDPVPTLIASTQAE
jgi:hypothetical protein